MKTLWCFLSFIALARGAGWHYMGDTGPDHWSDSYPICAQTSQSPINIKPKEATHDDTLPAFTFTGYNTLPAGAEYELKNNGHVAVVKLHADNTDAYSVSGGALPGNKYIADSFHWHWGNEDNRGSEHTVDGKAYPLEVHFVHFSSDYPDVATAADKDKGLAVLGFFFKLGLHNDAFDVIVDNLKNITYYGEKISITPFTLFSMLPSDLTSYWRYNGSLTTPPCYETVTWTVFQEPIVISKAQLEKFRDLKFEAASSNVTTAMVDTYRPVQPLGSRTLYSSVSTKDPHTDKDRFGLSSASSVKFTTSLMCLLFIASLLF